MTGSFGDFQQEWSRKNVSFVQLHFDKEELELNGFIAITAKFLHIKIYVEIRGWNKVKKIIIYVLRNLDRPRQLLKMYYTWRTLNGKAPHGIKESFWSGQKDFQIVDFNSTWCTNGRDGKPLNFIIATWKTTYFEKDRGTHLRKCRSGLDLYKQIYS